MSVVGRWEWRTFGDDFGAAEERLAAASPARVETSDEFYLLSSVSDTSAKIRDGHIDVKERLAVDDDGLEQWLPVVKTALPVGERVARRVLELLEIEVSELPDEAYTLDRLNALSPQLLAIAVRKRRVHHVFGGCMAEITELGTDAGTARTIAVEAEDPALVIAAVRALGLQSREIICVARGLKALVGDHERRYAVVDIGTNSVKFHVAQARGDGAWHTIADRAEVTRLGEGLDETGRLGDAPIERTAGVVAAMAAEAEGHDVAELVAVGTAALRIASNPARFADAVRARAGVEVEVITADEEARLAYVGATSGLELPAGPRLVFDTGGGSSQFTLADADVVHERFSVNVGAVGVAERFGLDRAVGQDTVDAAIAAVVADLARLQGRPAPDVVVGMGGAVTNLAAVMLELHPYDPDAVQGTTLEATEIERQIAVYRALDAPARREITGLQPARAEVILAGACIVAAVLAIAGRRALIVSDRGLRHGVVAERFGRQPQAT